jgi:hypothetical protein
MTGLVGMRGGNWGDDDVSNGQDKKSNKDEEKVKHEYFEHVQVFSNEDYFVEAVVVDKKPYLAILDLKTNEIKLEEKLVTLEDEECIEGLKPIPPGEYIHKPYVFKSKEDFVDCLKYARLQSLDMLYRTTKGIWEKYIDADDDHISLCAADTIFTYFQDIIGMTHYLFFVGDNDSGKSNNLVVFHYQGYRNLMSVGLSAPNVFQFLGSMGEGLGTICEDEATNIDLDRDKMDIAKSGYTRGFPVFRITTTSNGGRKQHRYYTYCFKAYAAEKAPDPIRGKGLIQRMIKLPCVAGNPLYDILEVVNPAGDDDFQHL